MRKTAKMQTTKLMQIKKELKTNQNRFFVILINNIFVV